MIVTRSVGMFPRQWQVVFKVCVHQMFINCSYCEEFLNEFYLWRVPCTWMCHEQS